jgi:hypothetical protein
MYYLKKILLLACLIISLGCYAQDSLLYKPLPKNLVAILQDTTLSQLVVTKQNQVTKNMHRIMDSLYGKNYPFYADDKGRYSEAIITEHISFILQEGNYIFVSETVSGGDRFGVDYGHLIVFNPTLSDSLPKVIYYGYNNYRLKINAAKDLIDASVGNNFKRQTPEEYKREH